MQFQETSIKKAVKKPIEKPMEKVVAPVVDAAVGASEKLRDRVQDQMKETAQVAKSASASSIPDQVLANTLGVASILLGATEFLLTHELARKSGFDEKYEPILKIFGIREMVSGVGILATQGKTNWLWSRVIGDVLDTALFGYAYYNERQPDRRRKLKAAFTSIAPIVAADFVSVARAY